MLNSCTKWVLLFHGGIVVADQGTEEAAIISNVRVDQGWKAVRIKAVTVRLVVLLVPRIIHKKCIQSWRTPNDDAIHCMGLMLGTLLIAIADMMEVAERE